MRHPQLLSKYNTSPLTDAADHFVRNRICRAPADGVGAVADGNVLAPGAATLVAHQVDTYAISGPAPGALLYTINGAGSTDGVYVRWFGL